MGFLRFIDNDLSIVNTCDRPLHVNRDQVLDYNGRRFIIILDTCQITELLLCNGRLLNDNGKSQYTFSSVNGQSNVDYLLLNFIDFGTLSNFLDFRTK